MKIYISTYSSDLILHVLSYNLILIAWSVKYITFFAVCKNIKEFRARIQSNWNSLKDNQENEIICKHGLYGKLFTIFIAVIAEMMCVTATESFSLSNAVHAFGLFKIASYRMKNVLNEIDPHMCVTKKYFVTRNKIMAAVDFHRRAIEFSELLKTSFGPSYLFILTFGICSASINFVHIFREIMADNREVIEIIKSAFLIMIHLVYFVLGNYAGQEFINGDTLYYNTICKTNWYNAPLKTQKLILFVLQKTTKCYKVDAGGMFVPCLEGLATSFSMSLSYFMVLYSM
ncbi:hypothetical protein PUN28_005044 [Cardiocondyla obscurior]|uniref:Uncharacterized protein n=1 Tax=Cardiocondyla obscurior TaxID=286306 RepID=A0AAW2GJS0_9HYME